MVEHRIRILQKTIDAANRVNDPELIRASLLAFLREQQADPSESFVHPPSIHRTPIKP